MLDDILIFIDNVLNVNKMIGAGCGQEGHQSWREERVLTSDLPWQPLALKVFAYFELQLVASPS
jgi:hypothetical protein